VETGAATVDHRCVKTEEHAVTAGHSVNPACWQEAFEGLMSRIAGRFMRVGSRRRARKLVLGLLPQPQALGFPSAGGAGEGEELGPGDEVAGQGDELAPDLVLREAVQGQAAQAGVLGAADASPGSSGLLRDVA
jgi:hypothetical protein